MERVIEVFVELDGTSQFVGRLWSRSLKGRESASFEYDKKWIASDARFCLKVLFAAALPPDVRRGYASP